MKNIIKYKSLLILSLVLFSCKLDLPNPNNPNDGQILTSREGMISLSIGMKQVYSTLALEALTVTPGTTSREVKGITTFTNIIELEAGGSALPTFNGNINTVWSRMLRVMGMAEDLITQAPSVLATDNPMRSGVVAHAQLFKAMALGGLATAFEQVPLQTDKNGQATFTTRQLALEEAINLLNQASATLGSTTPSTEFNTRVLGANFNLLNCINAYKARYNMMAGKYPEAITAANLVPSASASQFVYDGAQSINPVFTQLRIANNYGPRDNFGLPAGLFDPADGRLAFYLQGPVVTVGGEALRTIRGFAQANNSPIPVYLPDEMRLIKAEAIVRSSGILANAVIEINAVRQQSSGDPFGVHANLPAYTGLVTAPELLLEIYRQRCAELFLSGLRLEDSRRFSRPAPPTNVNPVPSTFERTRNFYPYPDQERLTNPNTPPDPAI
ncbi:MAG: RagB/SusD family nutrient uptake outer membrane protein [Chitinophagaceae bacterium]|nr:RagB/SusD family nutrient uptake outer membrane protein [Chitinophagaceae bacterium]MBP7109676.1 RagB/SusD family nutrient uptake outer membrane protein [Chitinophagaceae bacterium]MBP7315402.1 RagB/SusD family nutrient uptake outer membrane protein [Chitinophagaceae bacterium]HQX97586.1 RagB/SusD family nutrient uptake outer membrane protein [Chitinophagaceae bacterium]HQZ51315.1 RagB/SusD family nutrient uptake outer membrane protein [Chitinophagaceae bacterium]